MLIEFLMALFGHRIFHSSFSYFDPLICSPAVSNTRCLSSASLILLHGLVEPGVHWIPGQGDIYLPSVGPEETRAFSIMYLLLDSMCACG